MEDEKAKKQEGGKFDLSHLASIISNIVLVKSSNQQMQYMQKLVKLLLVNFISHYTGKQSNRSYHRS